MKEIIHTGRSCSQNDSAKSYPELFVLNCGQVVHNRLLGLQALAEHLRVCVADAHNSSAVEIQAARTQMAQQSEYVSADRLATIVMGTLWTLPWRGVFVVLCTDSLPYTGSITSSTCCT